MLENHQARKYEQPYKGPYVITKVNNNGTVRLKMGAVTDTVNIRPTTPCLSRWRPPPRMQLVTYQANH
jgi:hypothetical protein